MSRDVTSLLPRYNIPTMFTRQCEILHKDGNDEDLPSPIKNALLKILPVQYRSEQYPSL